MNDKVGNPRGGRGWNAEPSIPTKPLVNRPKKLVDAGQVVRVSVQIADRHLHDLTPRRLYAFGSRSSSSGGVSMPWIRSVVPASPAYRLSNTVMAASSSIE